MTSTCPHCGLIGRRGAIERWHFDNCPKHPSRQGKDNYEYSAHPYYQHFIDMLVRGKTVGCDFSHGLDSFNVFLKAVGPQPIMKRPTVGRYNHSKGYVFDKEQNQWNFKWEEFDENTKEGFMRGPDSPNHPSKTGIAQRSLRDFAKIEQTCPHCGKSGRGGSMKRWHFDNCSQNPNNQDKWTPPTVFD